MQKAFCFRAKRIGFQTTNNAEMMKDFFETLTFSNTRFRGRVQCCFGARFDFLFLDERCLFMYHKTNLVRTSIFKKFSKLLQGMKSSSIFLISIRLSRHQDLRSQKQKSFVFMRISLKEWKPQWFIKKWKKKHQHAHKRFWIKQLISMISCSPPQFDPGQRRLVTNWLQNSEKMG